MFQKIRNIIKTKCPNLAKFIVLNICMKDWYFKIFQKIRLKKISNRGSVKVIFFASTLSMWRYQMLYQRLSQDARFECNIVLVPFVTFNENDLDNNFKALKEYFDAHKIKFLDAFHSLKAVEDWIIHYNPDVLFYPQAYYGIYLNKLESKNFRKRLLCYYPYGIATLSVKEIYNEPYQNLAWKLFLQTPYHLDEARLLMSNKCKNGIVVGEPNSDLYLQKVHNDPWKKQNIPKKRIIWAPHHTITPNTILYRDSFLWLFDLMLEYAKLNSDKVQMAFKPHPRLKTELYNHPEWGKEKTDQYYNAWITLDNGQLEEGSFIDLFSCSDLLIHDCGSFTAEYLYTSNPVIFTCKNKDNAYKGLDEFGRKCLDLHYHIDKRGDLFNLIDRILFKNDDPLKNDRIEFLNNVLIQNSTKSVAELTYESIVKGLGWSPINGNE